jgi:hypothetical protein
MRREREGLSLCVFSFPFRPRLKIRSSRRRPPPKLKARKIGAKTTTLIDF